MNTRLVVNQKDAQGRIRFFVLPIESEAGFCDLVKFVSQEFKCEFGELNKGPGALCQKGLIDGKTFVFVLSDSTGTQFFAEDENDIGTAELIAKSIEVRLHELAGK